MFSRKIIINGKRLSQTKVNAIIEDAVDNIILSGFNSIFELEKIASINGKNNDYIIDNILFKLQIAYSNNIDRESKKSLYDKASAANVGLMIDKQMIILELIHRRRNNFIISAIDRYEYDDEVECLDDDDYEDAITNEEEVEQKNIQDKTFARILEAGKNKVNNSNLVVRDQRKIQW